MNNKLIKRYAALGTEFFAVVEPQPLQKNARIVHKNTNLISQLGLDDINDVELLDIISGNKMIESYSSLASVYMGHQFGVPVARLGDGRAMLIAEQVARDAQVWELQLKGAGRTPYSRGGDGRAVLRSSIREYLVSHAMRQLGIATTEAVAVIMSDDIVYRETPENAAIVMRAASTFIRFGNFEYFAYQNKLPELRKLVDFTCQHFFTDIVIGSANYVGEFLRKVVKSTAKTIAQWQAIGFVHGVMNTDNMSIVGLTLDYGPYAFMDEFMPQQIYNHSDSDGRYVYANQPQIAWWNLYRLAEALIKLDGTTEEYLQNILDSYATYYNKEYQRLMWSKLGIVNTDIVVDTSLIEDILHFIEAHKIDYTLFWRKISFGQFGVAELQKYYPTVDFQDLLLQINHEQQLQDVDVNDVYTRMQNINPAFILRNHLLHDAIMKAKHDDYSEVDKLFQFLNSPFIELSNEEYYYGVPPSWSSNVKLSCSS